MFWGNLNASFIQKQQIAFLFVHQSKKPTKTSVDRILTLIIGWAGHFNTASTMPCQSLRQFVFPAKSPSHFDTNNDIVNIT